MMPIVLYRNAFVIMLILCSLNFSVIGLNNIAVVTKQPVIASGIMNGRLLGGSMTKPVPDETYKNSRHSKLQENKSKPALSFMHTPSKMAFVKGYQRMQNSAPEAKRPNKII